jgi:2-(1,2-epoxy-1,2-dihydrophenyl)acetyl-CoA isomerase
MSSSKIVFSVDAATHVATIRIDDPASRNAVTAAMGAEIREAALQAQSSARALVLAGGPKAFCAGANLSSGIDIQKALDPSFDLGTGLEEAFNPMVLTLRDLSIPWISAVRGAAAGIGASIALAADLIVAGDTAYFLEAFRRIGLVPDGGSTYLLTRAVGRVRAMEMMLLGEKLPAAKALEWGLVNRVVPDAQVEDTAFALAAELAKGPTRALGLIRQIAWKATDTDLATALQAEREAQRETGRSADFREGVTAFLEKRPAKFTGQ